MQKKHILILIITFILGIVIGAVCTYVYTTSNNGSNNNIITGNENENKYNNEQQETGEYNPLNLSFLTIFSIVFWYATDFKTATIFSLIISSILVSILSNACGIPLSIIQ